MNQVVKSRGAIPREQERQGIIRFETIANHGTRKELELLTAMKNIVSKHLPNMALDYISRIVYDIVYHESLLLIDCKTDQPFGGICFRPFPDRGFVEIVFCAVDANQQVRGYGSYLMSHLKKEMKKRGIYHILTYADNQAIGYFMKQGFQKNVKLEREKWCGYIKDYVEATLMECVLHKNVEEGKLYVMTQEDHIHGVFYFAIEEDPTYAVIHDGAWHSDGQYGVIHRIAGDGSGGILRTALAFAREQISHLRIDTHADNSVMQRALNKQGFRRCGIIYIADGSPRIAYDFLS